MQNERKKRFDWSNLSMTDKFMVYGGVVFGGVAVVQLYRLRTNHKQMMSFFDVMGRAIETGRVDTIDILTDAAIEAEGVIKGTK